MGDQNQPETASVASLVEGWGKAVAAASIMFFSGLFIFQLGFFQYIGFGFLGLIGSTDLLINTTIILPPIVGVIVGLGMGMDDKANRNLLDVFFVILNNRVARIILTVIYMIVITYYIFTDPILGVFVIPFYTVGVIITLILIHQWLDQKTLNYNRLVSAIVCFGMALLTTGYISARNIVCCSKILYTIKGKDAGEIKNVKILRSSEGGLIYSLEQIVAFLAKDQISQVSRQTSDLGK
jgi:hypothetical protein